jgi:hypothetical protein
VLCSSQSLFSFIAVSTHSLSHIFVAVRSLFFPQLSQLHSILILLFHWWTPFSTLHLGDSSYVQDLVQMHLRKKYHHPILYGQLVVILRWLNLSYKLSKLFFIIIILFYRFYIYSHVYTLFGPLPPLHQNF